MKSAKRVVVIDQGRLADPATMKFFSLNCPTFYLGGTDSVRNSDRILRRSQMTLSARSAEWVFAGILDAAANLANNPAFMQSDPLQGSPGLIISGGI